MEDEITYFEKNGWIIINNSKYATFYEARKNNLHVKRISNSINISMYIYFENDSNKAKLFSSFGELKGYLRRNKIESLKKIIKDS